MKKGVVFLVIVGVVFFFFISTTTSLAGYAETVMGDVPFAYYRLGESFVTDIVQDEMGSHHGSFQNEPTLEVVGALLTDSADTSVCFDSTQSQYVQLTTLGNFGSIMTGGFTVEYWLRTTDQTNHQTILGAANTGGFYTDFLVDIANHEANELRFYFRDDYWNRYEARFYPLDSNVNIYDDVWHHIVHVYDPSASLLADRVIFYVDAQRQSVPVTLAGTEPLVCSNFNVPMVLAAFNKRDIVMYHFNGCLDEVAFYTYSLNIEEVQSHYEAAMGQIIETCEIDIHPDTLNKKSKGKYVTCYIELPEHFDVYDIDIGTVLLSINGVSVAVEPSPTEIGDYNGNNILDCMVKFDRQSVQDACNAGAEVFTLSCETYDGTVFEGTDTVLVIDKGQEH